ncbi:hypothetical protein AVEN_96116-1 [Araneus ventricosus]|uniref:Uncharacterized protein n=1 Tax=Araneus ventricosus TaxID=182803 RepID=A0A4Y2TVB0_ARAVE|nr:hypothetical protein AVEN_96116-1 [Araneus ventricosus]
MNRRPIPRLTDAAIMKVAVLLYDELEIKNLSIFVSYDAPTTEWSKLINDKVSKLSLPAPIQNELATITSKVWLLLAKFNAIHRKFASVCQRCQCWQGISQSCPFWISDRLFSEKRIVEGLIRDKRLGVAFRFKLGSEYFIE